MAVSYTHLYANGCSSTATIQITVNPIPVIIINASNNSICFGDSSILTAVSYTHLDVYKRQV